jgi:CubicO group peptidase (beta-lactamase class C family)
MKFYLYLLLIFGPVLAGQSQIVLNGKVINGTTEQPVPYANIGIANTEIGTISNEDGTFSIHIPLRYAEKNILFSSVGYTRKSIDISSITDKSNLLIYLNEEIVELEVIEVSAKREKNKTAHLGNGKSLLLSGQLHYDTLSAGSAMALLIEKKDYKNLDFLNKASLYIAKNLSPEFKVRLRLMSVDALTNQPGIDLIKEQLIQVSNIKKGWLDFDFSKAYQIKDDSFYLVFEWIMDSEDRDYVARKYANYMQMYPDRVSYDTVVINNEKVSIPKVSTVVAGTVFGVTKSKKAIEGFTCYYRSNSFGEWKRSPSILSAKVTLSNYPVTNQIIAEQVPFKEQDFECKINEWANRLKDEYGIPGLQLSIAKNGKLLYSEGYGYADVILRKKVTNQTQFRIASVSKTMTSIALMQLLSKGMLNLDSAIQVYVPSFPVKQYPVSVRQLAGHLGGIRDYHGNSWDELFVQDHYRSCSEALVLFKEDSLEVEPGTQFHYSSYGYILLGAVIENLSGQSYLGYMKQHVWEPLEMNFTYGDVADSAMVNKSKFYFLTGEEATPYNLSYSYPTGGLISTSDDLVKFGSALVDGELIDEKLKHELFNQQYTSDKKATGYGLGWFVSEDINNKKIWYHTGELPSSGSVLLIIPEQKIVIALLSNTPMVSDIEDGILIEIQKLANLIHVY